MWTFVLKLKAYGIRLTVEITKPNRAESRG